MYLGTTLCSEQMAKNVIENGDFVIPAPLEYDKLEELMMEFGVLA